MRALETIRTSGGEEESRDCLWIVMAKEARQTVAQIKVVTVMFCDEI